MSLTVLNSPTGWTEQLDAPLAGGEPVVTITVQITVVGEELPPAATRLLTDLEELVASQPVTAAGPAHGLRLVPAPPPPPAWLDEKLPVEPARPAVRRVGRGSSVTPSLVVCAGSRLVLRDGVPIQLTRREYDLLLFFLDHPRRVFSRAQLLRHVWGYDMVGTERTVDVHVRRLRVKLGDCAAVVTTVRGIGYRLDDDAPVAIVIQPD
jgi:DNA-binding winged helix-turn-helix (wHTH) protein